MSSNYIIEASVFDIDEILMIEKDSYEKPWKKQHFADDIKNKFSINYVCKNSHELIGYLFGYLIEDEYHLNKITVKKTCRQKKVGKSLFAYCLKQLSHKNVNSIQLEVSSLNLIAQNFYKSLNFIEVGVREKYYSDNQDALLYNLEIK